MKIAVLGWGSFIWCLGSLQIKSRWHSDGPSLPIEFARISKDGRLTLVIDPRATPVTTYWALSIFGELDEARSNLSEREGTSLGHIRFLTAKGEATANILFQNELSLWLHNHADISAMIWTGLDSNWETKRGVPFTSNDAVQYLAQLEAQRDTNAFVYDRAREYLTNAPKSVQTEVRKRM